MMIHEARTFELSNARNHAFLVASILLCVLLVAPVTPRPATPMRAQPALVEIAAGQPDTTVKVIVQKTVQDDRVEHSVADLGGAVTRDLSVINAFAAEIQARHLPRLAQTDGVKWISADGPVRQTQVAESNTYTTWASELGTPNMLNLDLKKSPISAGLSIWFNSVLKPSDIKGRTVTVRFQQSVIRFSLNGQDYVLDVPDAEVIFSPAASQGTTLFDTATNTWRTIVPADYDHETFLSGLAYPVTTDLPQGIEDVMWEGRFTTDTPDIKVDWKWAAAVYTAFNTDYNALSVKPVNKQDANSPYWNDDKAGTPERYKSFLIKGASSGGGTDYTGHHSGSEAAVFVLSDDSAVIDPLGPDGIMGYGGRVQDIFAGFDPEITPGHAIARVEALLRIYVPAKLSHDFKLKLVVGGASKDVSLKHAIFDPYVGAANVGTLAVDLTGLRTWRWGDFDSLNLVIDQSSLSDDEMVYYDAIGLRVTSATGYDPTGLMPDDVSWPDLGIDPSRQLNVYNSVIGADRLWNDNKKLQGQGVTVAVVDSGIYKTGDLSKSKLFSVNFSQAYHDSQDRFGHGTFVAGVIAGNGSRSKGRHLGVAPKARLINIRVSDDQGMSAESDVVAGLQWIYENKDKHNIRVVNLSLNASAAQSYTTSPLCAAVEMLWLKGIVVVVSAGNNGSATLYPPANDPFVITVGATDDRGTTNLDDDTLATFSAYGTTPEGFAKPDLVAPGRNIIAFLPGNEDTTIGEEHSDNQVDKNYFRMSGTSMSAPMVTGAVALLLQDEPNLTPNQVKYRLMATANKSWPGYDAARAGAGYLDTYAAVHGTSTESANAGVPVSRLLWDSLASTAWSNVSWDSVSWDSVSWDSVSWDSVSWDSVSWDSVSWDSVSWDSVSWDSDYWGP